MILPNRRKYHPHHPQAPTPNGSFPMPAPPNPKVWTSTPAGPRLANPRAAVYKGTLKRPPGYGLQLLSNAGSSAPTFGGNPPLPLAQDDNVTAHSTDYPSSTGYSETASENSQDARSSPPCTDWDLEAASDMTSQGLPTSFPSSSRALGVLDPYAAGLFLDAFDQATGILNSFTAASFQSDFDEAIAEMNSQIIRIVLAPDAVDSYSFTQADDERDQVGAFVDPFWTEEDFRDALTNTIKQMMYVSGETGEPSVETTGIIEDIVRQQVVEIVSRPSNDLGTGCRLTMPPAPKLHRACGTTRVALHHHQRPHLPNPRRRPQGLSTPHISLLEGRPQERQGL